MRSSPPRLVLQFFRWFCHRDLKPYIEGDLHELYQERLRTSGRIRANIKFTIDVLLLFRPGIIRPERNNSTSVLMYKNYFIIAFRNLLRSKGYSSINIGGLALGMSVALLIGLWIHDELSFNHYHTNYQQIAKVLTHKFRNEESITSEYQPTGLGTYLKENYSAYFNNVVIARKGAEERIIEAGENKFTQTGFFMQPEGPEMFSFKMLEGTNRGLKDMKSILLSKSLAEKLFGDNNPLNQTVRMDSKSDLKVTGVYEDLPGNSDFKNASFIAPLDLFLEGFSNLHVWDNYNMNIYVRLANGHNAASASPVIQNVLLANVDSKAAAQKPQLFLLPMDDWHLKSQFKNGKIITSDGMKFVWFYAIIGIFVLTLACINFMNLSTARSEKRAKEVGIRKSIGSHRFQLIQQFFSESFLVSTIAFIVAMIIVTLTLSQFNVIAGKEIHLPFTSIWFWIASLSFILVTGLLAGSYPALYLSSFQPLRVLKGTFNTGKSRTLPRQVMVVMQFTVSVTLIIGTIVVYQQIQFAKNRPVGYSRQGLITFPSRTSEFAGKYDALSNELKNTGVVDEMAAADYALTTTLGNNDGFSWDGKDENSIDPSFNTVTVSHEYGTTVGWEFVAGRDFSRDFSSDFSGVVVNESAAKLMAFKNPVGQIITRARQDKTEQYTILGVVKDMVKGSPFEPTNPAIHFLSIGNLPWKFVRINENTSAHEAIPKISDAFNKVIASTPFDYKFADEDYNSKFRAEERVGTLAFIFSALAIFISFLGLFGLSAFVAEQRTREIGIRKILGASVLNLWKLLSTEFFVLVILACVIAIPVAYHFMSKWLLQYSYRISLQWEIFVLSSAGALLLTLLTVSIQSVKASIANPVKSLRSE